MGEPKPVVGPSSRLESVDLLRGVVMVIMALDHVRDFMSDQMHKNPVDLETTTASIFLTRWITHYCAPTFIFLAGTSAFLAESRGKSKAEMGWLLFTRGLWLAFFEVVINRIMWMFSFDFMHHGAGVFWAIGWAMVVLSVLIYLPTWAVTAFGIFLIAGHNLLDGLSAQQMHLPGWLWVILHQPGDEPVVDGITFGTGYCLIPWIGTMAAGYGFGTILLHEPDVRRKQLLQLGSLLTLAFIVVRAANVYGDPSHWSLQRHTGWPFWRAAWPHWRDNLFTFLSFLNCTKYPASLCYLLMTLGPSIIFLGLFDKPVGAIGRPLLVFGRVPMFYYLLHIPLIHGTAVALDFLRFGWSPQTHDGPWAVNKEVMEKLPDYGFSLPVIYLIWLGVVFVLYWPCRWYAGVKSRSRSVWFSYL